MCGHTCGGVGALPIPHQENINFIEYHIIVQRNLHTLSFGMGIYGSDSRCWIFVLGIYPCPF